ncbi:MAG TPA: hypothetical protein VF054_15705 [Micromonosporaceae bacterium]
MQPTPADTRPLSDHPPAAIGGHIDAVDTLTHNQGNAATGGVYRVHGPHGTAILKIARPPATEPVGSPVWQTSDNPTHWNYWHREATAYTTGFAATAYADAGIQPPTLLAHHQRDDGAVELWLADATGTPGTAWPIPRLQHFAHQLGAAQARWVDRIPDLPWLSRDWLSQYLTFGPASRVTLDDTHWDHPLATLWPGTVRQRLRDLWQHRDRALAATRTAPRTLCHLDVWPTNLIEAGATTILLDWAFVGDGALGEDPANLIVDSVTDGLVDAALLPDITTAVTDGYLAGLRDGGWTGPTDTARRAIAAAGIAKYAWYAPGVLARCIRGWQGHPQYAAVETAEQTLHRVRDLVTQLADWAGDLL